MTHKPYCLHPGHITSLLSGEIRYIAASKLCKLYGLSPSKCSIYNPQVPVSEYLSGTIHLYPRDDGNYRLPKRSK